MELTPLSAAFLKLCDGRTLDRVASELKIDAELESLGREQVTALAFQELHRQRLLTWKEVPKSQVSKPQVSKRSPRSGRRGFLKSDGIHAIP